MWWILWCFVTTSQNTLWHMWPPIKWKTVAKFLCQGYILIFRALTKLLSDWGINFESNIIRELCKFRDIHKVRTSPYHTQTNGQVEQAHQTLMCMIGKLSKDQKADWLRHLPKLVLAYNSMRSVITGYSLHDLMFWQWLHLPTDFYFPMIRGMKEHLCVDHYIAELCEWLREAFKEAQVQSASEVERQKWHYNRKAKAISLEPGDLTLTKADAYREEESERLVGGGTIWSGVPSCRRHPFLPCEEPVDRILMSPPPKLTFSHHSYRGDSLLYSCVG